ncbi:MAG: transposase [Planctomycetaceae bacterium]|nr:transposase [Planctomycetaceae bacterium]
MRRLYPSDLSDARWNFVEPLIQKESVRGRKRSTCMREVINAINYRWSTGCAWRMLPHDYPPWETVYTYFDQWKRTGKLWQIREVLIRNSLYLPVSKKCSGHKSQSA